MSKLIVKRSTEWMNRGRDIELYLDKVKLGVIRSGENKTFEIPSGSHKLKAVIDWCSSAELAFRVNEDKSFSVEVSGFKLAKYLLPAVFVAIIVSLAMQGFGITYTVAYALLLPPFLFMLYYVTLARKRYLVLKNI